MILSFFLLECPLITPITSTRGKKLRQRKAQKVPLSKYSDIFEKIKKYSLDRMTLNKEILDIYNQEGSRALEALEEFLKIQFEKELKIKNSTKVYNRDRAERSMNYIALIRHLYNNIKEDEGRKKLEEIDFDIWIFLPTEEDNLRKENIKISEDVKSKIRIKDSSLKVDKNINDKFIQNFYKKLLQIENDNQNVTNSPNASRMIRAYKNYFGLNIDNLEKNKWFKD